jgi:hypothetical protein
VRAAREPRFLIGTIVAVVLVLIAIVTA